jgi:hypothetical protein
MSDELEFGGRGRTGALRVSSPLKSPPKSLHASQTQKYESPGRRRIALSQTNIVETLHTQTQQHTLQYIGAQDTPESQRPAESQYTFPYVRPTGPNFGQLPLSARDEGGAIQHDGVRAESIGQSGADTCDDVTMLVVTDNEHRSSAIAFPCYQPILPNLASQATPVSQTSQRNDRYSSLTSYGPEMLDEKYEKGIVSHREQGVRISAQASVDASVGAGEHCSGGNDERGENQMPGAKKEVDGQPLAHCAQNEVFTRPLPQDSGGKGRAAKLRREKALIEAMQAAPNLSIDLMSQDFPLPIVGAHALPNAPKQACVLEGRDGVGASPARHLRREGNTSNICQATLSSDPCSRNLNAGEDSGKSDGIVACTSAALNPHAASGAHQPVHPHAEHAACSSTSSAGVNGHANATQRNSTAVCEQQAAAVSDDTQALAAHDAPATGNETVRNFLFFFLISCYRSTSTD